MLMSMIVLHISVNTAMSRACFFLASSAGFSGSSSSNGQPVRRAWKGLVIAVVRTSMTVTASIKVILRRLYALMLACTGVFGHGPLPLLKFAVSPLFYTNLAVPFRKSKEKTQGHHSADHPLGRAAANTTSRGFRFNTTCSFKQGIQHRAKNHSPLHDMIWGFDTVIRARTSSRPILTP